MANNYLTQENGATLTCQQVMEMTDLFIAALPSEISDYIFDEGGYIGRILAHPFYRLVGLELNVANGMTTPDALVESIAARRATYEKMCAAGEFEQALWGVDKAYRAEHLNELLGEYGVKELYSAIGSVWIDVENIGDDFDLWDEIWGQVIDGNGDPLSVMDAEDRKTFNAMPKMLTIYRGFRGDFDDDCGWSWSLDRAKAEWFARRRSGEAKIAIITIPKRVVLAYFGGRNESEIVLHPEQFGQVKIETLGLKLEAA